MKPISISSTLKEQILHLFNEGETIRRIAKYTGISKSRVHRIISATAKEPINECNDDEQMNDELVNTTSSKNRNQNVYNYTIFEIVVLFLGLFAGLIFFIWLFSHKKNIY